MAWVSLGVAAVGTVAKVIVAANQAKKAREAEAKTAALDQQYANAGSANVALAQQLYGGRMFGASQLEQNIFGNQANTMAANEKGATSGSQYLAQGAATQGQTNQALKGLQLQEYQNKYGLLNNLNLANQNQQNVTGNRMFNQQQQAIGLRQSSLANIFGAFNDASSIASLAGTAAGTGSSSGGGNARFSNPYFDNLATQSTAPNVAGQSQYNQLPV